MAERVRTQKVGTAKAQGGSYGRDRWEQENFATKSSRAGGSCRTAGPSRKWRRSPWIRKIKSIVLRAARIRSSSSTVTETLCAHGGRAFLNGLTVRHWVPTKRFSCPMMATIRCGSAPWMEKLFSPWVSQTNRHLIRAASRSIAARMSLLRRRVISMFPTAMGTPACTSILRTESCFSLGGNRVVIPGNSTSSITFAPTKRAGFMSPTGENHRVQVFDGNGKYETQWNNMHRPCALYMDTTRARSSSVT